jgi:hypothetical protein
MLSTRRAGTTPRKKFFFLLAHLLLLTLAIRPLHVHELRGTHGDGPQLSSHVNTFCPECTFGGDQVELTSELDVVALRSGFDLEETSYTANLERPALPSASRGPPAV